MLFFLFFYCFFNIFPHYFIPFNFYTRFDPHLLDLFIFWVCPSLFYFIFGSRSFDFYLFLFLFLILDDWKFFFMIFLICIIGVTRSHDPGHGFQKLAQFDFDVFLGSFLKTDFFQFHHSTLGYRVFSFVIFIIFFLWIIQISYLESQVSRVNPDLLMFFLHFLLIYVQFRLSLFSLFES
jgi:hypothetical protein